MPNYRAHIVVTLALKVDSIAVSWLAIVNAHRYVPWAKRPEGQEATSNIASAPDLMLTVTTPASNCVLRASCQA